MNKKKTCKRRKRLVSGDSKRILSMLMVMAMAMAFLQLPTAVQADPVDGEAVEAPAEYSGAAQADAEEGSTADGEKREAGENAAGGPEETGSNGWDDLNPATGEEDTWIDPEVFPTDEFGRIYTGDYFGFTRAELVAYLEMNRDLYIGTPYQENSAEIPAPGADGHMQCEGFVWHVLHSVAAWNTGIVPCGDSSTDPITNGGGWVDWLAFHNISYTVYGTKEEMLASGKLEKGDIIWSFDKKGPLGISNEHHVGFFWGDTSADDLYWHSSEKAYNTPIEGSDKGNRLSRIEGMADPETISQWWVVRISDDTEAEGDAYAEAIDVAFYEKLHPELPALADPGEEEAEVSKRLRENYLTVGIWKGEAASERFDILYYMKNNPDLNVAFGENRLLYLKHYVETGRREGRPGSAFEAEELARKAQEEAERAARAAQEARDAREMAAKEAEWEAEVREKVREVVEIFLEEIGGKKGLFH